MEIKTSVTLLIVILVKTACTQMKLSLLGGERWKVVGFFHICHGKENRTLFNKKSYFYNESASYIFGKLYHRNTAWNKMFSNGWTFIDLNYTFDYVSFDVCEVETLIHRMSDLFLDQKYFLNNLTEDPPLFNNKPIPNWRQQTNILNIITHLPESYTKIAAEMKSLTLTPIHILNPIHSYFVQYIEYFRIKIPGWEFAYSTYRFLNERLKTDTVDVILFKEEKKTDNDIIFDLFVTILKSKGVCVQIFSAISVSYKDHKRLLNILQQDDKNNTIILYGHEMDQMLFFNLSMGEGLDGRTWVMHNVLSVLNTTKLLPKTTLYSFWVLEWWFCYFLTLNTNLYHNGHTNFSSIYGNQPELEKVYLDGLCEFEVMFDKYVHLFLDFMPNYSFHRSVFSKGLRVRYNTFQFVQHNGRLILLSRNFQDVSPLQRKKCDKFICHAGWERTYGQLLPQHTHWNNSYGWTCSRCPLGYFKDNSNNESCKRCLGYNISNNERTLCIDPFVKQSLNIKQTSVLIAIGISGLTVLLGVSILIIFFKHRSTPVVKAADLKFSTFHLTISCIIGISLPLLYIGIPSDKICLWRYISVTILFSASLAVIALKSYKIIKVFESKVVLNKREVLMTPIVQICYIVLLLLIGVTILIVSCVNAPPHVQETRNVGLVTTDVYCENALHIEAEIGYFIPVLILCAFQAYRGRNLPAIFNEGTPIIYCSFTLIILYLCHFPIYYFQRKKMNKSAVQLVTLLASNMVVVVVVYSSRVYTILFKASVNTKSHMRKKLQEHATAMAAKNVRGKPE